MTHTKPKTSRTNWRGPVASPQLAEQKERPRSGRAGVEHLQPLEDGRRNSSQSVIPIEFGFGKLPEIITIDDDVVRRAIEARKARSAKFLSVGAKTKCHPRH